MSQKVKKPTTSYVFFARDQKDVVKGLSVQERNIKLASMWSKLSEAEKKPYVELGEAEKRRFDKERPKIEKPPKPQKLKGPSTSFVYWCKANQHLVKGMTIQDRSKHLSSAWKKLSDDEKQPYVEMAKADRERWKAEPNKPPQKKKKKTEPVLPFYSSSSSSSSSLSSSSLSSTYSFSASLTVPRNEGPPHRRTIVRRPNKPSIIVETRYGTGARGPEAYDNISIVWKQKRYRRIPLASPKKFTTNMDNMGYLGLRKHYDPFARLLAASPSYPTRNIDALRHLLTVNEKWGIRRPSIKKSSKTRF
jgi:hypothetical protein